MPSPLIGAWEQVSDQYVTLALFTESHFSIVGMDKNRKGFKGEQPTRDEIIEAYDTSRSLAGTYTISGNRVTFKRIVNQRPDLSSRETEWEFTIEGDALRLKVVRAASGTSPGLDNVFKKLS